MMSAGDIELRRVVNGELCGRTYSGRISEGAELSIAGCEKQAADGFDKVIGSARMDDAQKKIFTSGLRSASRKAFDACVAETGYIGINANGVAREKLIACTSDYVAGRRLFDFEGQKGLSFEKLLEYQMKRARREVRIRSTDIDMPSTLRSPVDAMREIEGGFFSRQAEELFRCGMSLFRAKNRALVAESIATWLKRVMAHAVDAHWKAKSPEKRAALKDRLSRKFPVATAKGDTLVLDMVEVPSSLFTASRLGIAGPVTAELQGELRRIFTAACGAYAYAAGKQCSMDVMAAAVAKAVKALGASSAGELAGMLRERSLVSRGMTTDASNRGGVKLVVVLRARCAGEIDEISNRTGSEPRDGRSERVIDGDCEEAAPQQPKAPAKKPSPSDDEGPGIEVQRPS
jgi:hypothetical protein